jgi:DNA-directed RNA polymerase subunit RPC12/RpoP
MTSLLAHRAVIGGRKTLRPSDEAAGFRCIHCREYVSTVRLLSGVGNRNHCPYCLHSRHLDWQQAGDRLAACKGSMQPVGLVFKHRCKRYGLAQGELMIVHRCIECGKLSINRIAADDNSDQLLVIFQDSQHLERHVRAEIEGAGIQTTTLDDFTSVLDQLFGRN